LEQVLVDLYDVAVGHGCASCFPIAILCLATENRTQDAGHALLRQGRNPKVRKNSGVILTLLMVNL
ncbi:MAG: hypothetical protein WAX73_03515, partial [Bifidobacterium adolescentis]